MRSIDRAGDRLVVIPINCCVVEAWVLKEHSMQIEPYSGEMVKDYLDVHAKLGYWNSKFLVRKNLKFNLWQI